MLSLLSLLGFAPTPVEDEMRERRRSLGFSTTRLFAFSYARAAVLCISVVAVVAVVAAAAVTTVNTATQNARHPTIPCLELLVVMVGLDSKMS